MHKVIVPDDAPVDKPLYAHLEVVVDYLLHHGCALAHKYRWGSTREGFFCDIKGEIDFDELEKNFIFPLTIILGRECQVIYCQKTGCQIKKV